MRLNFLCPQHLSALEDDPLAARELWLSSDDRLDAIPPDPTPHRVSVAGSALEAAHIYLRAHPTSDSKLIKRYTNSALTLIELLVALGQTRLGIMVVAISNAMVEELAHKGADSEAVLAACRRITLDGMARLRTSTPSLASRVIAPPRGQEALTMR
ncbi:MAG: hypothetical protein AAGA95_12005 [Pseudomonadota bacterium]